MNLVEPGDESVGGKAEEVESVVEIAPTPAANPSSSPAASEREDKPTASVVEKKQPTKVSTSEAPTKVVQKTEPSVVSGQGQGRGVPAKPIASSSPASRSKVLKLPTGHADAETTLHTVPLSSPDKKSKPRAKPSVKAKSTKVKSQSLASRLSRTASSRDNKVPVEFLCAINGHMMKHPVR